MRVEIFFIDELMSHSHKYKASKDAIYHFNKVTNAINKKLRIVTLVDGTQRATYKTSTIKAVILK